MIGRFLGRFPRFITTIILGTLAVSIWQATIYVDTVVRPREAAERQALVDREIARAEKLFQRGKYETALSEYEYVLTGFPGDLSSVVEGKLRDRVGTCLVEMARAGNGNGSIERGIEAYRAALALRTAETDPAAHAETWYHIGEAHMTVSATSGEAEPVTAAVEAFESGLAVLSAETDTAAFATGLRSIGNAHRRLYALDSDSNPLDNALRHYEEALRVAKPIEHPVEHGETLMEIGRAQILLAEHGYRLRNLQKAIKTYEKVLGVYTVEKFPRLHASAHKEMGDTYTVMSRLKPKSRSDRAAHQQRVIHYENKAKQSYRIAKSFGLEPGFEVAGADNAEPAPVEEEKKAQ